MSLGVEEYGGPPGAKNGIGACQPTGPTGAGCKCNCRHLSRRICKLHPDCPEIKDWLSRSTDPHKDDWWRLCELNKLAEQVAKTEFSVHSGGEPASVQCMEVINEEECLGASALSSWEREWLLAEVERTREPRLIKDIGIAQEHGMAGVWG